jgi:hypothetical protein
VDVRVESREQTQDNLHAAAYFDIEPGVIADRPMPPQGADGDVMLDHVWRLPG